jgi:hypothetical protein
VEDIRRRAGAIRKDPAESLELPVEEQALLGERSVGGSQEEHAEEELEHAA